MGFRDPAPAEVTATLTGPVDLAPGSEVTTAAGSQVTPAGAVGWADLAVFDVPTNLGIMGSTISGWAYVGNRAGVLFRFTDNGATNLRTRFQLEWHSDPAVAWAQGTTSYGEVAQDVRGGQTGTIFAVSRGPYVRVRTIQPAGGDHNFGYRLVATDRPHTHGTYLGPNYPMLVSTGFVNLSANGNYAIDWGAPYTGPALLSLFVPSGIAAGLGEFYLTGRDFLGNAQNVAIYFSERAGPMTANFEVFVPPLIMELLIQNRSTTNGGLFLASLTPTAPR